MSATDAAAVAAMAATMDRAAAAGSRADTGTGRALAAALRGLIDDLAVIGADPAVLAGITEQLVAIRERLAAQPRRPSTWAERTEDGRSTSFFELSPIAGQANPLAPPIAFSVLDDTVVGVATYGPACEGPPGIVHGGLVAAAFDEVLGLAQSLSGQFGMTGTLSVRYRRPTPLGVQVRYIGRVIGVSGRKIRVAGEAQVDGAVTAEAEGLFIAIGLEGFASLDAAQRQGRD